MKKVFYIFILLFFILPLSHAIEPLTIVRGQNFPPYHFVDKNGIETGFVIETINGVTKAMGIKVIYKQFPWSRCMNMMEKGYADAMMNLFKTKKRAQFIDFAENILAYETNTFFSLKDKNLPFNGVIKNLTPFKIGTIRNYSYGERFDVIHFPSNFQLETETELLNTLTNKRCDIIIGNKLVILNLIKTRQLDTHIKALSPDVSKGPLFIGFSKAKGHEALSQSFSKHLKQFKASPDYRKIVQTYSLDLQ